MAAISLPDGQDWVVSGRVFRRLMAAVREAADRDDSDFLVSLEGYEAVKGITLGLLDAELQEKLACLLTVSVVQLLESGAGSEKLPHDSQQVHGVLRELSALLESYYKLPPTGPAPGSP